MNPTSPMPLISVVVATYNGEKYLAEQLDSIVRQTYKNLEILILDDGSTDKTLAIVQSFLEQDDRIKLIQNPMNLGYVKNFEKGFQLAKGEFIAPSDQDDIWIENKLEILYSQIGDHPIAVCDSTIIDENGQATGKRLSDVRRLISYDNPLMFAIGTAVTGHAMLIKKSISLVACPYPTMVSHDYWIGFVATLYGTIKYVDKPLVLYRQHSANTFGVAINGLKREKKKKEKNNPRITNVRLRMQWLYEKFPEQHPQKKIFKQLWESYQNFSLANNFKRMYLFYKYRKKIMAFKHRNEFRKTLFCFKMFTKIV